MWWALGCSLPYPSDSQPDDVDYGDYERRDTPFADSGAPIEDSSDGGAITDTADTSGPTEHMRLSGGLLVHVSDATHKYAVCDGLVMLFVTGSEITGSGNCLLEMENVWTYPDELALTFEGAWPSGADPEGWVYAQSSTDSFLTTWTGTWTSDSEMRGDFFVVSSDELYDAYDGEFVLTRDE